MSQCSPRVILYCNMRYYGTCAAFPPQLPWSEFRMPTGHINTATDIFLNMSPYCSVIHLVCHTDERLWRVSHTLFGSNLLCLRNCHQLCSWRLRFYSLQTGILWVQTFSLNKLCADGPAKCRCKHLISFGARFSPTSLGTYVERGRDRSEGRVCGVARCRAATMFDLHCYCLIFFMQSTMAPKIP